jgi:hypothetical protein
MHRSLSARDFNQRRVRGDEVVNIPRPAKQQAGPPAALYTASVKVTEAITEKQITAGSESAHHLVASATNIAPSPKQAKHVHDHDQVKGAGGRISLQVPFREGDVAKLSASRARPFEGERDVVDGD